MLGGAGALAGIARYASDAPPGMRERIGLRGLPRATTLGRLLSRLDGPLRTSFADIQNLLARLIAEVTDTLSVDESATPPTRQREASALLALADGLTTHVLVGLLTEGEVEKVLYAHLAGLWECLGITRLRKTV